MEEISRNLALNYFRKNKVILDMKVLCFLVLLYLSLIFILIDKNRNGGCLMLIMWLLKFKEKIRALSPQCCCSDILTKLLFIRKLRLIKLYVYTFLFTLKDDKLQVYTSIVLFLFILFTFFFLVNFNIVKIL